MLVPRTLETRRLVLRRPEPGDAAGVLEGFASDPAVTRFLSWRPHRDLDEAEAALAGRLARLATHEELSWMVVPRATGRIVGLVSAWPGDGEAELGFVLGRSLWGQGLATEALEAVVGWLRASDPDLRLWATCDPENAASARVLEKAGFRARGPFPRRVLRPNLDSEPRPSLLFEYTSGPGSDGRSPSTPSS